MGKGEITPDVAPPDATTVHDADSGPSRASLPPSIERISSVDVLGRLGDGGMGVVYRAWDPDRGQDVALKTLTRMDEASFERLKREFRVVADIAHENLVTLHELKMEGGVPFFTMELVEGTDFLTYIRGDLEAKEDAPLTDSTLARARSALAQLARGIAALHAAGKLHRDLKPSNVMVTPEGRVVVLDFGLALESRHSSNSDRVAGTPVYMAPEQAAGFPLTPAADCYAIGVMFYRALTNALPPGRSLRDIAHGVRAKPERPSKRVPLIPADLDELCYDLLRTTPEARPTAEDVLLRLGQSGISRRPVPGKRFIGRGRELGQLDDALAEALGGSTVVALVSGPPGVGKSTLLRRWLDKQSSSHGGAPLLLSSRCRERETFAFKIFDGFVEGVVEQLSSLEGGPNALSVEDTEALGRLFPVLQRLAPKVEGAGDAQSLRRRGFRALKGLFTQLASERPLILFIDDLQWSDSDSAELLAELLAAPAPAPLLVVATSRSEPGRRPSHATATTLREVEGLRVVDIVLEGLTDDFALAMARGRAAEIGDRRRPLAFEELAALARDSGGNPFFIEQLVFYASSLDREVQPGSTSLMAVLRHRVDALGEDARRLLETVAVAGAPIAQQIAIDAAKPEGQAWTAVGVLRGEGLVRTDGAKGSDAIETLHDRIRESVVGRLAAKALASRHAALAEALELAQSRGQSVEAAQLATHFHGAGDKGRAGGYALTAAQQARASLAFDRAARLYALALDCEAGERGELLEARANALVDGGRCAEAAPLYRDAALRARPDEALRLRGLAAQQLMVTGQVDEGMQALVPVLEAHAITNPKSATQAIASILWQMARVKLRGLRFTPRPEGAIDPRQLERIDVCWGAGKGLLSFDSTRAAHFLLKMLVLALSAGERVRASRALAIYGMMLVFDGTDRGQREGRRALELAVEAAPTDHRYLEGTITICRGTADMSIGAFRRGLELLERGVAILEDGCANIRWECAAAKSSTFNALLWLGEIAAIRDQAAPWQREGQQLGDVFAIVTAELYGAVARLAADEPGRARAQTRQALDKWTQDGFHYQHWLAEKVLVWCDLYEGRPEDARHRLDQGMPRLRRSGLLRVQLMELDALMLDATVDLALADASGWLGRRRALDRVAKTGRELARVGRPASSAGAKLLEGQLAAARGRRDDARRFLEEAVRGFDGAQTAMHALCTRRRLAQLGDGAVDDVDARLRVAGIAAPRNWSRLYVGASSAAATE